MLQSNGDSIFSGCRIAPGMTNLGHIARPSILRFQQS